MATTPKVKLKLDLPDGSAPVKVLSLETRTGRDKEPMIEAVAGKESEIEMDADTAVTLMATAGTLGTNAQLASDKTSTHIVKGSITHSGTALSTFEVKPGGNALVGILTDKHKVSLSLGAEAEAQPEVEKLEDDPEHQA